MHANFVSECDKLARYLTGRPSTPAVRVSYEAALHNIPLHFSDKEQLLWNRCLQYPWILPHVDAWLGFRQAEHPIRKKIFIMLGVLETQPDYSDFFLPARNTFHALAGVIATGISAVTKIFTGRVITWLI